jgi:vitamin B12 transporter
LRKDDNEQFGNNTTGGVAWGYALTSGLRLTASYGTAFKAPSFNELYFPDFGNPDLDPEESRSYEFGVSQASRWGRWSVNAYETRIDDLIAFDNNTFLPANVDNTRIRGLEFILSATLKRWRVDTTLTLLEPENLSPGIANGNELPRRAEESLRLDINRQFGKFALGATLLAQGDSFDDLANTRKLDSYATVDLRAEYAFAKDWRVQLRVENLFDEDYETASFFNQPGRGAFVTLRYQP